MAINFDKALGIHEFALELRAKRAEVIANNLANSDTPGYKAQDLSFDNALKNALQKNDHRMTRTHEKHYSSDIDRLDFGAIQYVTPNQTDTGDGNSVDTQKEMSKYAENALEYQATLTFLERKFQGIKKALKGE